MILVELEGSLSDLLLGTSSANKFSRVNERDERLSEWSTKARAVQT
jgi:hypothetical protein